VKLDPLFNDLRSRMNSQVPMIEVYSQAPPGVSGCLFVNPASCIDMPAIVFNAELGFLFWDVVHPTTEAHHFLGDYMYDQLASEYE
jgi:cholinesterase